MDANEFLTVCKEGNQALESKEYLEVKNFCIRMLRKGARGLILLFSFIALVSFAVHVAATYSHFFLAQHIAFWILCLSAPMIPGLYILLKVTDKVIVPSIAKENTDSAQLLQEARKIIVSLQNQNQKLLALPQSNTVGASNPEETERLKRKLSESEARGYSMHKQIYSLEQKLSEAEDFYQQAQRELSRVNDKCTYLKKSHCKLEQTLKMYQEDLKDQTCQTDCLQAEKKNLECMIECTRNMLDKTEHELAFARKERDELQKTLDQKSVDYENLKRLAPAEVTGQMQ